MHRLKPALAVGSALALVLLGAAAVSLAAMPARETRPSGTAATRLSVHMTDREGGLPMRTFVSSTNSVYAVVTFEGATNESYQLRLRDLVGIEVFNSTVRLNGDGSEGRAIAIDDFVASYRRRHAEEQASLEEVLEELTTLCANAPGAPVPTAEPTRGVPTATPDPFVRWRSRMLDAIVSAKASAAEYNRTLQALHALPDLQGTAAGADLVAASAAVATAVTQLDIAEQALSPVGPGPGTPTPEPPQIPDPAAACTAVTAATAALNGALVLSQAALAAVPADTSTWRFPPTTAMYSSGQFQSCQPYSTELFDPALDTAATATNWTIGTPGVPALTFPSAEEVDRGNLGQLGMRLPEGATALYANTVVVPGVNHSAQVSAFVTDAQCIPVDGVTITFGVDPSTAGTVEPRVAVVTRGEAVTTLTAGMSATLGSEVTGTVCHLARCSRPDTSGLKQFNVIGPVKTLVLKAIPRTINRVAQQRSNISVRAIDENGRDVADGTAIELRIKDGDPGVLARDVQPTSSGEVQSELLGKTVSLLTHSGYGQAPAGNDPGMSYSPNLYLQAGSDGDGVANLVATSDGETTTTPVTIESRWMIYMPAASRRFTQPDATATPRRPRLTPSP